MAATQAFDALSLVVSLRRQGVRLSVEGDELVLRGNPRALTRDVLDLLKSGKASVLALLGQEQEIERLIRLGAPLEERDAYGFSPLCLSVLNGLPDSTQMLLDAGASPEAEQTLEFISIDRWVQQFPKLFNIPGLLRNVELAARLLPSNRVKSISRYLPIGQDCIRAIASIFELAERNQTNGLAKLLDLGVPPDLTDSKGQTIWSKLSDLDAGDSIRFLDKRVLGIAAPLSAATMEIIAASAPELTA